MSFAKKEEPQGQELINYLQKRFANLWQRLAGDPTTEDRDFFVEEYLRDLEERAYLETTIANQYRGRYLLELVQNAVDAMQRQTGQLPKNIILETDEPAEPLSYRCHIQLSKEALYVANDGQPFEAADVRGLTAMGKSTKGEGRYIGHKGLGFRAVLEISHAPEIYSGPYQFGFSRAETLGLLRQGLEGVEVSEVPGLSVPFPRSLEKLPEGERQLLSQLQQQGYVTIVRLPLKAGLFSEVVVACREFLNSHSLLFLPFITELTLQLPNEPRQTLRKTNRELTARNENVRLERVSLKLEPENKTEEWLLVKPWESLAIPAEYLDGLNDRTWQNTKTAGLALALPLLELSSGDLFFKRRLDPLPFFVHFPTKEATGLGLALHAEFYLSVSRKEIDGDLPYNRWLAKSVADFLCREALPALQARYPDDINLLDLLADVAYHNGPFGHSFRQLLDERLAVTAFVPVGAGRYRRPVEVVWTPLMDAGVLLFRKIFPQPPTNYAYPVLQLEQAYLTEEEGFDYRRLRRFLQELGVRSVSPEELPDLMPQAHKNWLDNVVTTADICLTLALWLEQLGKGTFTPEERQRLLLNAARNLAILPVSGRWEIPGAEVVDWPATEAGRQALKSRQEFFGPVLVISEQAYDFEEKSEEKELEGKARAWHKRLGVKSLDPEPRNPFADDERDDDERNDDEYYRERARRW